MVRKIGYLLSIVVIIFSQSTWAEESSRLSSTEKFVVLADIHFDPFFACAALPKPCSIVTKLRRVDSEQWDTILANNTGEIAGFGEDTNYALLQLVLVELQKINQINQPQFILILGDFLAHSFHEKYIKYSGDTSNTGYTLFVKKTLQFLTYRLNQIFPNVSIYPAVGNNDTYTENYNVVPNGLFLQDTAITWSSGIKNEKNKNSFLQVFPKNGYYAITLAHKQKILVLNTVLFSSKSR